MVVISKGLSNCAKKSRQHQNQINLIDTERHEVIILANENTAAVFREVVRMCIRKLGLLQKADAACCGITVAQCHTLVEIGKSNFLSLNELSELLALDKSTMSRTVDNLVNAGLVERQIDKADRRYTKIMLTAKGREMVCVINNSMEDYYERVLSSIPQEKREIVGDALPYLLAAVKSTEMYAAVRQIGSETAKDKGGCNCE